MTWFAFPALSKIVTAPNIGPCQAGANSTVSLHCCFGKSCSGGSGQLVAKPNTCGLLAGTVAIGFPKVIGGPPFLDGLSSVNFTLLTFPTFTLPKFTADGLTFSTLAVGVAIGVGVAVGVGVGVGEAGALGVAVGVGVTVGDGDELGVAVGVAVGVGPAENAITRLNALTVPMPVAKSHPVPVPYAGSYAELEVDSTPYVPDGR